MKIKQSILVVDDDQGFLSVVQGILEAKGFEVVAVPSAGEALSKAAGDFYNVAILDIVLPDMEGTELLSRLLEKHPDTIAIMLTGHSSLQNAIQSLNRGAFAYLQKPLDPEQLLATIFRGLERQQLVFENRNLLEMTLQRNREISALNRRAVKLLNERAKMIEDLEQRNREVRLLLSVAQVVSKSLQLRQIIDSALEILMEPLEIDCAYLQLIEGADLVLHGHRGCSPELVERLSRESLQGGVSGQVVRTGLPSIVPDLSTNGHPELSFLLRADYYSFVSLPLKVDREVIGVLGAAARLKCFFSKREIELLETIAGQIAMAINNSQLFQALEESSRQLEESYFSIALALVRAAEAHEPWGQGHLERVAQLSRSLALDMGLPPKEVREAELGGLLHDIGTIAVPNHILLKPKEEHAPEERSIYRTHVIKGIELIGSLPFLPGVLSCIEHHHERWDGSGYPQGLEKESIPLEARIVAVADAFDALTSERPWGGRMEHQQALQLITKQAGSKWDPQVVQSLLHLAANGLIEVRSFNPAAQQAGGAKSNHTFTTSKST